MKNVLAEEGDTEADGRNTTNLTIQSGKAIEVSHQISRK